MSRLARSSSMALMLGASILATGVAFAADRTAEAILKDLESVEMPKLDASKRNDAKYVRNYITQRQESSEKRAALILELYKAAPGHVRIPALMVERWRTFRVTDPKIEDELKEIEQVSNQSKDPEFKLDAIHTKAQLKLAVSRSGGAPDLSGAEEFLKLAPKDPRGAGLLYSAWGATTDTDAKAALEERIINSFPDSRHAGIVKGGRHQREGMGKPFELEFTDAIKGTTVSIEGLKGKVVVIDFWATWCGPCVAEMPKMKDLYAKYRDQGVEFIGVSLDNPKEQGGLDKLKTFVKEKEIAWPQYYQGKGWASAFSTSWGINSIPRVFVVDADGKLYSVEARGKLEQMIPALLKKKNATSAVGTGRGE